jgi:hypothetical protein
MTSVHNSAQHRPTSHQQWYHMLNTLQADVTLQASTCVNIQQWITEHARSVPAITAFDATGVRCYRRATS